MHREISQVKITVGINESNLTTILTDMEHGTVRETATIVVYSQLVFERKNQWVIPWVFDRLLWGGFSNVNFSENDMSMLYFAFMVSPYSKNYGIENFSKYYFEKKADSLTEDEMNLLVALSYYPVKKTYVNSSSADKLAKQYGAGLWKKKSK
ncbi:MAG: hypothetical protein ACKE51_09710 [Methylococcaceae bacterium]